MFSKAMPVVVARVWGSAGLRFLRCALSFLLVGAWMGGFIPAAAQTDFGPVNGGSSSTSAVTATFAVAGTVAQIQVLTQGVANLDFIDAGGGTCSISTAYTKAATCTVIVKFSPHYAGNRTGAIVLSDASGNVLANTYIRGNGQGSQVAYVPAVQGSASGVPIQTACTVSAVALDGAGNEYVACLAGSQATSAVYKEQPSGTSSIETKIAGSFGNLAFEARGVAVDGAGNVFVSDDLGNRIFEVVNTPKGYVQTLLPITGLNQPMGLVLDGTGSLYIASSYDERIVKVELTSGNYVQTTIGTGILSPISLAVDANGNVYLAESCGQTLCMLARSGNSYNLASYGATIINPLAVATDNVGNVYVESPLGIFRESLINGSWVQTFIYQASAIFAFGGVDMTTTSAGNLLFTYNQGLDEVDQVTSGAQLTFTTTLGVESAPQSMGIINLGNTPLQSATVSIPPEFRAASPVANPNFPPNVQPVGECGAVSTPPGEMCTLSMTFLPLTQAITFNEDVIVASSSLVGSPLSIPVQGNTTVPELKLGIAPSADPIVSGQGLTITMSLAGVNLIPPDGTFTLSWWTTSPINTQTATFAPDATGKATYTTSSLPVGSTTFSVSYTGDTHYSLSGYGFTTFIENVIATGPGTAEFGNPNMGDVNVGSSSNVASIDITFTAAETLGGIAVVTQGAPNLDFQNAGGGTCAVGNAYSAGQNCTVNVVFKPRMPGPRYGAIVLTDTAAHAIGTGYLQGIGVGPQVVFPPGSLSAIAANYGFPQGLRIDAAGDIYFADSDVYKLTPTSGGYTQTAVTLNLGPTDVAVDGSGNVYAVAGGLTPGAAAYKLIPAASGSTKVPVGYGLLDPLGVAVDGAGNVYVAGGAVYKETPVNGGYSQSVVDGPWTSASSVALDGAGNLYVADASILTPGVYKATPASETYTSSPVGSGWVYPISVAVDVAGNVYVADNGPLGTPFVAVATPQSNGSYTVSKLSTGLKNPKAIAVDASGNVFISAWDVPAGIHEITVSNPQSLSFAATMEGATSSDSPKTVMIENGGNASLSFSAISYPGDFPEASSASGDCKTTTVLTVGAGCTFSIDFTPQQSGAAGTSIALTETVAITAVPSGASFSIPVAGTENIAATSSFTIKGTAVTVARGATTGNTATITVAPGGGFTGKVTLTAAITASPTGAQYPPTFTFSPASSVTVSGAGSVTANLTISTTAPSVASDRLPGSFYAGTGGVLACCLVLAGRLRRRRWSVLAMVALGVLLGAGVLACGGGGSGGGGGQISGTTQGSYTITVTGTSGSTTATGTVSLTVQ